MKKTILLILALCLCVGLCACGQSKEKNANTEPTKSKTIETIELNNENISQYLNIKIGDVFESTSKGDFYDKCVIEIYPLQAGNFANVDVVLEILTTFPYVPKEAIGATLKCDDNNSETGTLTFKLPADGRYEIDVKLSDRGFHADNDDGIYECKFQVVSGTFTPTN